MAREFILKDYYNFNYSQLLYLFLYVDRWLVIINCSVLLSSRVLGLLFAKYFKKKKRKKKGGRGFEVLHGLFPSGRCILRDLLS